MREWADFTVQEAGGRTTIVLQGPLTVSSIGLLDRKLREYTEPVQFIDMLAAKCSGSSAVMSSVPPLPSSFGASITRRRACKCILRLMLPVRKASCPPYLPSPTIG